MPTSILPSWVQARAHLLGPFLEPLSRFLEREFDSLSAIPRGAQALAWLSEKIDAFGGQEQSAQEEVEFIDGSAAFLAAVLVDHMEKAQHVEHEGKHRLLLGNKGFFNPFQAIEAALDAPSARPVLVEQVALAEAEAKELKGYGRLARLLDQALAHLLPDATVVNRFESKVWIHSPSWESPIELNLGRLYPLSLEEPNDALLARAIESLIRSIGTPQPAISRLEALSRIYPRIVKEDFEMSGTLFTQPWFSRLLLCLVLDYGSRFRFVRNDELHAWELSPDEAISAALSNLADRSRGLRVEATSSLVFFCGKRDGFDASRILLPELREKLSSFLGSPFYFGIPHRDLLLVTPQDDNAAHMLLDQIQSAFLRAPHRISPSLFIGHPDRIQATELPGASFEPKLTLRRQA